MMLKKLVIIFNLFLVTVMICSCNSTAIGSGMKIGILKGPSGVGMVKLMDDNDADKTFNQYDFTIAGAPDEIIAKITSGELDAAAVPSNLAATLYNKTNGDIIVACVTTLGSLYILESGNTINSVQDLKDKDVYSAGMGASPECVLNFILKENGLDKDKDLSVNFLGEHAEVAIALSGGLVSIGLLPEPNATSVLMANKNVRIALDLNAEWEKICANKGLSKSLPMGCFVVNKKFLDSNKQAFDKMLEEYKKSIQFVSNDLDAASELTVKYDIMADAAVAKAAIPNCGIGYIDGNDMKDSMKNYLNILFDANPELIGGKLPDDGFYYE